MIHQNKYPVQDDEYNDSLKACWVELAIQPNWIAPNHKQRKERTNLPLMLPSCKSDMKIGFFHLIYHLPSGHIFGWQAPAFMSVLSHRSAGSQ